MKHEVLYLDIKGITYKNGARKTRRISKADLLQIKRLRREGLTYEAMPSARLRQSHKNSMLVQQQLSITLIDNSVGY